MLESFVNLAATDSMVSMVLSLAERYQCTPLEMLEVSVDIIALLILVSTLILVNVVDVLADRVIRFLKVYFQNRKEKDHV